MKDILEVARLTRVLMSLSARQAFQRAPAALRRYSFLASYVAVSAAGSMNVLFTRASEISGGVKVTDETGEVSVAAS